MAATHIDARAKHKPTKHEQRQAQHHATHPEHRGEQLGKHRTQGHNGTHPHTFSVHSGAHVSNPNVVHHHAISHSETATALNEKLKKRASIAVTARTQLVSSKAGSPYQSGHPYPLTPPKKAPPKTITTTPKPTVKPSHPATPSTSPYKSGHPYPISPPKSTSPYVSGHPYPTKRVQAPDQGAKASSLTHALVGHNAIDFGTYGTPYYRNPQSNVPAEGSASTVSAVNRNGKTPGTSNIMQEGHGNWGGFGFDPSRIIPNIVSTWHSIFG